MIASVLFPLPLPEAFDYAVPAALGPLAVGDVVICPLGRRETWGVVWELREGTGDNLKPLSARTALPPLPEASLQFIARAARYVAHPPWVFLKSALRLGPEAATPAPEVLLEATAAVTGKLTPARAAVLGALAEAGGRLRAPDLAARAGVGPAVVAGLVKAGLLTRRDCPRDERFREPDPARPGPTLNAGQAEAAQVLRTAVAAHSFQPVLLDGVTGSGKTEVYLEAVASALSADPSAQVLVLVPEIALTQAVLARFEARFGAEPVAWHSGLTAAQRARAWREVASGRARLVVGARSALFLPYPDLGLIVVDEEHDASYKQDEGVPYHARDLAVLRAQVSRIPVVLASATPSLESLVNAESGRYAHVRLTARAGAARLPEVQLIDMRTEGPPPGQWLSPVLVEAVRETLSEGGQSLLYLNRRGYAPLVLCKACGHKLKSPDTESWLVEHRYTGRLVCHLTGWSMPKPAACPQCGTANSLIGVGPGVERVAEEVQALFPRARLAIFSSDTATGPQAVRDLIGRMERGEIDILIGTQIVAKGHNFPQLTLVGVVDADSGLKGADLRAGERTWQLLSQVAGRAGRADRPGRALLQTWSAEHPAMQALAATDRETFLSLEQEARRDMGFPPFGRLAALILSAPSAEAVDAAGKRVAALAPSTDGVDVYGPAPAPIAVVRGRHRRRFLVRADRTVDLSAYMAAWRARMAEPASVRITLDIEPYSFL